jgi:flagellar secretion chaperone FliS
MYTPVNARGFGAYQRTAVETAASTANSHKLIVMLFDGLLESLNRAIGAIEREDGEEQTKAFNKAVRILSEGLLASLDAEHGGEVSANLGSLYGYCIKTLVSANVKRNVSMVVEVVDLIKPVADAWRSIDQA